MKKPILVIILISTPLFMLRCTTQGSQNREEESALPAKSPQTEIISAKQLTSSAK